MTGWFLILGIAFSLAASGCGQREAAEAPPPAPEEPEPQGPVQPYLPPPATDRIEYNSQTRTLTFYDLPQSSRWMVQRPDAKMPDPVGPDLRLPEGLDPDNTFVFYRREGGQQSRSVSVADIQAARQMHVSTQD